MPDAITSVSHPGWRYCWALRLALTILIPHALWKSFKTGNSRYIRERLGFVKNPKHPTHWWHAASVGEVQTMWPLLQGVIEQRAQHHHDERWLVTTNTATGYEVLTQRLNQTKLGNTIRHAYCPIDTPGISKRFVSRVNPVSAVIVETELWPNLYTTLCNKGRPVTIVNGRATHKTTNTVTEHSRLRNILRPAFKAALSKVRVLARSEQDAKNYIQLGAQPTNVTTVGDLKFADNRPLQCSPPLASNEFTQPYVVAASTHPPEEEQLAAQWMKQATEGLLVLVPRHFDHTEALYRTLGKQFPNALPSRRSDGGLPNEHHRLYIADTLGELHDWFSGAEAAFIGGSLIPRGGHNVLEPYFHGVPVITGKHTENFSDSVQWLKDQNLITQCENAGDAVRSLLEKRQIDVTDDRPKTRNFLATYLELLATHHTSV